MKKVPNLDSFNAFSKCYVTNENVVYFNPILKQVANPTTAKTSQPTSAGRKRKAFRDERDGHVCRIMYLKINMNKIYW